MAKIIHCPACGSYYNGTAFSVCPYCKGTGRKESASGEKGGILKRLRSTVKTGNVSSTAPTDELITTGETSAITETGETSAITEAGTTAGITGTIRTMGFTATMQTVDITVETEEDPGDDEPTLQNFSTRQPQEDFRESLKRQIRENGQTMGTDPEDDIRPTAGWLVGVKGAYCGRSFTIHRGRNRIGRGADLEISLKRERMVSGRPMAVITFDPDGDRFTITEGESERVTYINGQVLCGRQEMTEGDLLEFGDEGQNQFMFVPFCGARFPYRNYETEFAAE